MSHASAPRFAAAALAALAFASCGGGEPAGGPRPNVLLVSIDSLRPDHLGCYGHRRNTSPVIDQLAAEGALFEAHVSSAPWTLPAHAAMFTSVPDSVHGLVDPIGLRLSEAFETLPESFQAAGYRTQGFFAGPYLHPAFGFDQGFDSYVDCVQVTGDAEVDADGEWSMDPALMRASHQGVTNGRVYERWRAFLDDAAPGDGAPERPFFAFVHLWDVHFDFTPPAPYDELFDPGYDGPITGRDFFWDPAINAMLPERDRRHIEALYDGEIRWTDSIVGRIRDDLEARGLLDETIVVITSDHGTELFDHGGKGHRTTLFDEQIMIPLVIRYPHAVEAGVRHAGVTRMIDLGPTLRDLAGLPAASTSMGRSLGPVARGGAAPAPEPAVAELMSVGRNLRAVRVVDGKLIHDVVAARHVWFDLAADPGELDPRAPDAGDPRGARLMETYRDAARVIAEAVRSAGLGPAAADVPDAVRRSLQGLGYFTDPSAPEDGDAPR